MTETVSPRRERASAVFVAHGLTKIYRMGEAEVHALRDGSRIRVR